MLEAEAEAEGEGEEGAGEEGAGEEGAKSASCRLSGPVSTCTTKVTVKNKSIFTTEGH